MSSEVSRTDVAIIGAGPIGLFAVFECGMLGLKCHLVDALDDAGGQLAALYPEKPIFDIPGYPRIDAADLVARLQEQAAPFAPVYHLGRPASRLSPIEGGRFLVETESGVRIDAGAVLIAAGVGAFGPNRPPLPGIEAFEGKSVHYFVKRRADFAGKRVAIAGGGDSAVDWALALADIAARVTVIHRRDKFRAAPESAAKLRALVDAGRIDLAIPFQLHALEGKDGTLSAITLRSLDGAEKRIAADALLAFFGMTQEIGPIAQWGLTLEGGRVVIDPATGATSRQGIFAAGDIVAYPGKLKLILTGFAEAASAAHAIWAAINPGKALHFEYSTTRGVPSAT